ncbi:sporulation histidine kinase inhibitor Sda [Paenibacillus sp. YYML68]|nr:sporulation histidine kinase inhibitor Sda [Paenibacillus sp. YYML68]
MASSLNELTDQQLLNVLKAARELKLDAAFITLIESELQRHGTNINQ